MELWSAFLLGLLGSLHCAGMCGPLVLAMPAGTLYRSRLIYNAGRLATYASLGLAFGVLGQTLALAGWQRWASIAAGVLILLGLLFSSKLLVNQRMAQIVGFLKSAFGKLLHHQDVAATFMVGALNGLLPCGLVYAACAAAIACDNVVKAMAYMLIFGLGTVPMMLAIAIAGKKFQFALRLRLASLVPICLVTISLLLILRGLALGIPFLSPAASCCQH